MCGIVGTLSLTRPHPVREDWLRQMLAMIRHRGPDQFGIFLDEGVALGSARLSIIDVGAGQQPIANEDETVWVVFNGEVFNHVELRPLLEAKGHRFSTHTDTEVVLHLYEELGPECLRHLNGDFAVAIWDGRKRTLFLARDRVGVRPLFYTVADGALIFGSEIKALLADPRVGAEIDPVALDQIFTFWSPLAPRSVFRGIQEIPPGHYLLAGHGKLSLTQYWRHQFNAAGDRRAEAVSPSAAEEYGEELEALLLDATRIRLRADVPVGAYLSGGLDSSIIAALIRNHCESHLDTFSIAFSDPKFDESCYQRQMAGFLGTDHQVVQASHADIGDVFPEVIWHTEIPILRTAPAPMFLLSKLVRDRRFKVVLTGEGADEFLAGYDVFKEAKIRRFWASQPSSTWRPLLLRRLYPDIAELGDTNIGFLSAFFADALTDTDSPCYSHAVRWRNTRRTRRFFSNELADTLRETGVGGGHPLSYPAEFANWGPLERAQYLESTIFLSEYLLSSQGDRVAMAHSVEGRYPFLDYRVIEFCDRLPPTLKLRKLQDKYLLRQLGRKVLPPEIWQRPKRPYRAPIHRSFFHDSTPEYVRDVLSPDSLKRTGFFKPGAVSQLVSKIDRGLPLGETDDMALAGILSTELVHRAFISDFHMTPPLADRDDVKVCLGAGVASRT